MLAVFAAVILPPGHSWAQQSGISYDMVFKGIEGLGIEPALRAISDMEELKGKPPAGIGLLRSRAERDRGIFVEYLHSQGWYAAGIDLSIDRDPIPVVVTFHVETGPPYLLDRIAILAIGEEVDAELFCLETLSLVSGERFNAEKVLSAQQELLNRLKRCGHPFPSVVDRRVTVDHRDHTVSVKIAFDPGPKALLGEPRLEGLENVEENFVRMMIPWKPGDPYSPVPLQTLHRNLSATGLFAGIRITEADHLHEDGELPITVSMTERKHRSVGAGISYGSDEGPGGRLSWEHRNVFKHGERLAAGASASDFTKDVSVAFQKPYFLRDDQWLRITSRFADERPDAYESRSLSSIVNIDRELGRGITAGAGVGYKESKITQLAFRDTERFRIVSLPLAMSWDRSDDLLDPRKGGRLTVETTPMISITRGENAFVKLYGRYRRYVPLRESPSIVAAGSLAAGIITGARHRDVPADERFYAGGGGSIRGYSYQSVGPLVGETPYGGRSLLKCSFELRTALTDNVGIVGFLDGGTAYESGNFGSGETFRWGTGLGLRYRTPVGPLRLDVGIPVNRRHGIDDSFQFYLSLGQAF